jgi:uncharacterized damage-inducible protein DinB
MSAVIERLLPTDPDFDPATQSAVAFALAHLDDQTHQLRELVGPLSPADLARQPEPGANTIGMLTAHISIAEAYWMAVVWAGRPAEELDAVIRGLLGIGADDDGMPLARDGAAPEALSGRTADELVACVLAARAFTRRTLLATRDSALAEVLELPRRTGVLRTTRRWILYHVIEHQTWHLGQIATLAAHRKTG